MMGRCLCRPWPRRRGGSPAVGGDATPQHRCSAVTASKTQRRAPHWSLPSPRRGHRSQEASRRSFQTLAGSR